MKFTAKMQFESSSFGAIQTTGIQPVTLFFTGVDSDISCAITTDMSNPLVRACGLVEFCMTDDPEAPVAEAPVVEPAVVEPTVAGSPTAV